MVETQREVSAYALPLPSVVYRKFPTFPQATALQHCFKSSCRASSVGGARGARPTIFGHAGRVTLPMWRPWRFPAYDRFTVL